MGEVGGAVVAVIVRDVVYGVELAGLGTGVVIVDPVVVSREDVPWRSYPQNL